MATSKQEQIYNEIVEYYDFADRLVDVIEHNSNNISAQQVEMIESIVGDIEKSADQITTQFIEFVKDGNSDQIVKNIKDALNNILFKIGRCRNQLYLLCNKKDE